MNTTYRDTSDDEWIPTETASTRLMETFDVVLANNNNTLIEAPTSLGKTHHIATTPWLDYPQITDGEPVIHLHKTTDARDQAANMSEDAGLEYRILENRKERCPVARGDYDDELRAPNGESPSDWFDQKCDQQEYAFSRVHRHLENEFDGLPCQYGNGCQASNQWANVPRNEDGEPGYDVIHATHHFARVTGLIEDSNVVIDERPSYTEDIEQEDLRRAVNDHLARVAPEEGYTWPKLIAAIINEDYETLTEYQNLLDGTTDERPPLTEGDSHRLAPTFTRALASAEPAVENRFTGRDGRTTVVIHENGDKRLIRRQPAFSEARCIIGLDAHPSRRLWEQNTGTNLQHTKILSQQERRKWRRNERGLQVIQIGNWPRPLTGGWRSDNYRQNAKEVIRATHRRHGDDFRTCITPMRIEKDVEEIMMSENIENSETMHYGEQHSKNKFEGEAVGLLIGCIDPGDGNILDLLAEQGLEATPEQYEDGNRANNRGFVGPDTDAAHEFLESVREENVAQAIGRYARKARDENEDQVTVYAWTDAIPEHMVDGKAPGVTGRRTNTKDAMLYEVDKHGPITVRTVAEEVGCGKEYVRQTFNDLVELGVLSVSEGTGKYGANEYEANDEDLSPIVVDLDAEAV